MTPEELRQLLAIRHEYPNVELKGPGALTDQRFFSRVVRAILAMANTRDGGKVLLGVDEKTGTAEGLSADELATWKFDDLRQAVNKFADPFVDIDLTPVDLDGKTVLVIKVAEFSDVPVICKKDGAETDAKRKIVRQGACYVRGRTRGIESVEIPSHVEMRELLDIATNKRLRSFLAQARAAGFATGAADADGGLYAAEQSELNGGELDKIRGQGHWLIAVRPRNYVRDRVKYTQLAQIVRSSAVHVSYGYGDFPSTEGAAQLKRWDRFIGADYEIGSLGEGWRFFESGQFLLLRRFMVMQPSPSRNGDHSTAGITMVEIVGTYLQAYEFASRLAQTEATGEPMVVEVQAIGLSGLVLVEPDGWFARRRTSVDFPKWARGPQVVPQQELLANARGLAMAQAYELLQRFAANLSEDALRKLEMLAAPRP